MLDAALEDDVLKKDLDSLAFFSLVWPTDQMRHPAPLGAQSLEFWIELGGPGRRSDGCVTESRIQPWDITGLPSGGRYQWSTPSVPTLATDEPDDQLVRNFNDVNEGTMALWAPHRCRGTRH